MRAHPGDRQGDVDRGAADEVVHRHRPGVADEVLGPVLGDGRLADPDAGDSAVVAGGPQGLVSQQGRIVGAFCRRVECGRRIGVAQCTQVPLGDLPGRGPVGRQPSVVLLRPEIAPEEERCPDDEHQGYRNTDQHSWPVPSSVGRGP
ncbi:hypothetical protein SDC9_160269 [bioreactor metagenome]|uniref:Uncharacterized protein n=1 Tax=bioreactor metagenome TaxID=1076179 RepID=A0A645FHX9_9ZZZZ